MSRVSGLFKRMSRALGFGRSPAPDAPTEAAPPVDGMGDEVPPAAQSKPEDTGTTALSRRAKFQIGQVVRHRMFPFRGVIFDVDPEFANTEEWYDSIPEEVRPAKEQPYYHLFAENDRTHYVAYVSEQNLVPDENPDPVSHPDIDSVFDRASDNTYRLKGSLAN